VLTEENDVEIHALAARGWSVSAISRHTGRDRKTVRRYLAAPRGTLLGRDPAPSCLEPFRAYSEARFDDDAHLDATVLHRDLVGAGSSGPTRRCCANCGGLSCGRCAWCAGTVAATR
jgi:transposase